MANDRRIAWRMDAPVNDQYGSNAVEMDVYHSKGGTNMFSGNHEPAGYWLSVTPVQVTDGCVQFVIGNSAGRRFYIASAPRFNAAKLDQLAAALKPHTAAMVTALLERNYDGIRGLVAGSQVATVPVPKLALVPKPERRDVPAINWQPTTTEKYDEMLNILPPAEWIGSAFLVGEPFDHCDATGQPRFEAYWQRGSAYFVADRPLTIAELRQEVRLQRAAQTA